MRFVWFCGILWFCGLGLSGCGTQVSEAEVQEPALIINEFKLSSSELEQELAVADVASMVTHEERALPGEEPEWLSRLIERELLVQEAQRLGLDRKQAFMGTIERFWKEALIKQLISLKARELTRQIQVQEPEIEAYYERLSNEYHARIMSFSDPSLANEMAQAPSLEQGLAKAAEAKRYDSGWQWHTTDTLEPALESLLVSTEPGTVSAPLAYQDRWIVVAVSDKQAREIEPLSVLWEEIHRTIQQRKQIETMEHWIRELREQARIVVDYEAIAGL